MPKETALLIYSITSSSQTGQVMKARCVFGCVSKCCLLCMDIIMVGRIIGASGTLKVLLCKVLLSSVLLRISWSIWWLSSSWLTSDQGPRLRIVDPRQALKLGTQSILIAPWRRVETLALPATSLNPEELLSSLPLVSVCLVFVNAHSLAPCLLGEGTVLHKLVDQLISLLPIASVSVPGRISVRLRVVVYIIHYFGLMTRKMQLLKHFF